MLITLKKIGSWLKAYWYVPAIVLAIIVTLAIWRKVPRSLVDMIAKRREIHQKEVEAIDRIHEEEIARREKALKDYHSTIKAIEEKYEKDKILLNNRKKKQIKKIVEETQGDPDLLAKKLADQTGFQIVYPKDGE